MRRHQVLLALAVASTLLSGCLAVSAASTAVGVTTKAAGATVRGAGAVAGAVIP